MKRRIIILATIIIISLCLTPFAISSGACFADIVDPVGVSSSLFNINTENGGETVITLTISNKLNEELNIKVSLWNDYTNMGEGETNINPDWVKSISPSEQLVPAKGGMTTNITFDIPIQAEELKYKTWLKVKVLDYPEEGGYWEKPITVIIRKGEAAEEIDFGVTPAYYRLLVNSKDAHITVDQSGSNQYTNFTPIVVKNKCGTTIEVYANAEDRNKDLVIDDTSAIKHTISEVGTVYKHINEDTAKSWFSSPYTMESPLLVSSQQKGNLTWSLDIPDNIVDGHYVFGVRVAPTENAGNTININYMVWILLDVERGNTSDNISISWWIAIGIVGTILAIYIVQKVRYRINEEEE